MSIDTLIQSSTKDPEKGGNNKKCFLFDEYVLLYGSFKENELKQLIQITQALARNGIAILPTLEYKVTEPPNELGYVRGYSLQQRAKGTELYEINTSEKEYQTRLKEIAEMSTTQMDKFVSDWWSITEAGLMIDPSKCSNFFYSNGQISFIDLNLLHGTKSLQECFLEASNILFGLHLKTKYKPDKTAVVQILQNLSRAFIKNGLSIDDIQTIISKYNYFLSQAQINSVIKNFKQDKPATKLQKIVFNRDVLTAE